MLLRQAAGKDAVSAARGSNVGIISQGRRQGERSLHRHHPPAHHGANAGRLATIPPRPGRTDA